MRASSSALIGCIALSLLLSVPSANAAQYVDTAVGYSFTYPDDWTAEPHEDGGVTIRNFPIGEYLHGGVPPMGGADIAIHSYPPYPSWWPPDTDEYQWLENFGRRFNVLVHPSRSTPGPARLVYTVQTPAGCVETSDEVAVRMGGRLFRIGVDYETDDPNGPAYEQVLSGVIDSLTIITQPTAPPAQTAAPPAPTAAGTP
jgi:hypothetical protein